MILVIDNYDSFVQNLARYIRLCEIKTRIIRNDEMSIEQIKNLNPTAIVISPGPCTPTEAGICIDLVKELNGSVPILGVCLGHQIINEAYGGVTKRGDPTHGRASTISHDSAGLFAGIPSPIKGGRYHSLVTDIKPSGELKVTAIDENATVMALEHKTYPIYGVQFHPESILTDNGLGIIQNFVTIAKNFHRQKAA